MRHHATCDFSLEVILHLWHEGRRLGGLFRVSVGGRDEASGIA
jgi:hypothetical protein